MVHDDQTILYPTPVTLTAPERLGAAVTRQAASVAWIMSLAIVFEAVIWYTYEHFVSPHYAYELLTYQTPHYAYAAAGFVLAATCAAFLPRAMDRPSTTVLWILYLMVIAPAMIIMYLELREIQVDGNTVLEYQVDLAVCFVVLCLVCRRRVRPFVTPRIEVGTLMGALTVLAIVLYGLLFYKTGLPRKLPSIADVYSVRADYTSSATGLAGYAASWLGGVINPFFVAYGLTTRRVKWVVFGFIGQLAIYATGGFKSVLFSSMVLAAFYFMLSSRASKKFARNIIVGSIVLFFAAHYLDDALHSLTYTALIIRRTFDTPGSISGFYLGFFDQHPLALYSQYTSWFIPPHYSTGVPQVIGVYFFPGTGIDANANLWADGFAQLGWLGLPFATIILMIILRLFDRASIPLGMRFGALVLVIPALSLCNSSVLTVAATHGLLLALVLVAVMPSELGASISQQRRLQPPRSVSGSSEGDHRSNQHRKIK